MAPNRSVCQSRVVSATAYFQSNELQGSISNQGDGVAIATAIVNTALGTSAAGICTLIFHKTGIVPGTGAYYSFLLTMNGSLTGK